MVTVVLQHVLVHSPGWLLVDMVLQQMVPAASPGAAASLNGTGDPLASSSLLTASAVARFPPFDAPSLPSLLFEDPVEEELLQTSRRHPFSFGVSGRGSDH